MDCERRLVEMLARIFYWLREELGWFAAAVAWLIVIRVAEVWGRLRNRD
jgi:hypothetical protein